MDAASSTGDHAPAMVERGERGCALTMSISGRARVRTPEGELRTLPRAVSFLRLYLLPGMVHSWKASAERARRGLRYPPDRPDVRREVERMIGVHGAEVTPVDLADVAGERKTVPLDHHWISAARDTGVELGD